MSELRIVPINAIDARVIARLGPCLEERFLMPSVTGDALAVPKTALNTVRKQLFFGSLSGKLSAAYENHDGIVLGITEFDLYKTSHSFVYGGANPAQRCAIVSLHRLRPEFYGEAADENVLFQRLLKAAVHEVGLTIGLKKCYNARCAMYPSTSIFDTDQKFPQFCEHCDKRSRAGRS